MSLCDRRRSLNRHWPSASFSGSAGGGCGTGVIAASVPMGSSTSGSAAGAACPGASKTISSHIVHQRVFLSTAGRSAKRVKPLRRCTGLMGFDVAIKRRPIARHIEPAAR